MNGPVTDMFETRNAIREDLATGRRHVYAVMKNPRREVATVPIGDVLCWCEGLDEAAVSRILAAVDVPWGKQIRLVSELDQKRILWEIKKRRPEIWTRWRVAIAPDKAA
jgi:hypothetical protein